MSSIRELRLVANLRPNLDDREAIQESFQEVITDLNTIKTQWNEALYPTIGSLPQGTRGVVRADRNLVIDPEVNGFDGSQVYMDMTARIEELGGLLHNGTRPKTIKEVVLEVHQSMLARVNLVEQLLDNVNVGNAAYDDTEVRAWIRQLAANTWDIDEQANGTAFNAANFTGDPDKSIATSIWQRVLNTRHLAGVEGLALTEQDISSLFAAANYISADTDIVTALLTLDAQVFAGGGAVTLQDVYDNSGAGTREIDTTVAGDAVELIGALDTDVLLDLKGGILFRGYNSTSTAWETSTHIRPVAVENAPTDTNRGLRFYHSDPTDNDEEFFRIEQRVGAGVPDEENQLTLGRTSVTANHQLFKMYLGREDTTDGGDAHMTIESYDAGAAYVSRIKSPLDILIAGERDVDLTAAVQLSGIANNFYFEGSYGTIYTTGSYLTLESVGAANLISGSILTLDASAGLSIVIDSGGTIDIDAADDITIDTSAGGIAIVTNDTSSDGVFSLVGDGIGGLGTEITSYIGSAAAYHHLGLSTSVASGGVYSSGRINVQYGAEFTVSSNAKDGWLFSGNNSAWTNGIIFSHDSGVVTSSLATQTTDDGTIGSFIYLPDEYADERWGTPATGDATALNARMGSFRPTAWAPHNGAASYGSGTAVPGSPDPFQIYKDNVCKSKGVIPVDVDVAGGGLGYATIPDAFNVDPTTTTWTGVSGILEIRFETALGYNDYTVTTGYESASADMIFRIQNKNSTGFDVYCRYFSGGAFIDVGATGSDPDFTFHYQVA